jgi:uncharacterized protein (DUF58 family)
MVNASANKTRRKQRLTRLGSHFLFVGTFAILGGSLRGFNLLLVLAAIVLATLLIQWRAVRRAIESVDIERRLPEWAFAGTPFRVRFQLTNTHLFAPLAMIRIDDSLTEYGTQNTVPAACGAAFVRASQTVSPYYDCCIDKRGRYRFEQLGVSTSFPFGLVKSQLDMLDHETLYVYPSLVTLHRGWQRELDQRHGGSNATARRSGPSEGDFFGLRDWQTGDSRKWIHWRTTARTDHPVVRQFEQQRRFDTCILVDAYLPSGSKVPRELQAVEFAISIAATIVSELVSGHSNRIVLALAGKSGHALLGRGSGDGAHRMMKSLTELIPVMEPDFDKAVSEAKSIVGYSQDLLVISSRSQVGAMLHQPEIGKTLQPWRRLQKLRWLDVTDSSIERVVVDRSKSKISQSPVSSDPARRETTPSSSASELATMSSGVAPGGGI